MVNGFTVISIILKVCIYFTELYCLEDTENLNDIYTDNGQVTAMLIIIWWLKQHDKQLQRYSIKYNLH